MRNFWIICLGSVLFVSSALAESRTFTNKEGKALSAELIRVAGEDAVLKLASAKRVNVPIASLSDSDQEFVKTWWEKNKNNVSDMDVRLTIEKKVERISSKDDSKKSKGKKGGGKRVTTDKFEYHCALNSYTPRELTDITAEYTIYKRISTRDKNGSKTDTETIDGSETIARLPGNQSVTFESTSVICEDIIQKSIVSNGKNSKGGKKDAFSKRETVLGIVITLKANGGEIMQQSYPENFIDRLEEAEERD